MSRTHKDSPGARGSRRPPRDITVRAVRRDKPDIPMLSGALIIQALTEISEANQSSQAAELVDEATTDQEPDV